MRLPLDRILPFPRTAQLLRHKTSSGFPLFGLYPA